MNVSQSPLIAYTAPPAIAGERVARKLDTPLWRAHPPPPPPEIAGAGWQHRTGPAADTPSIHCISPSTAACRDPLSGYYDIVFCTAQSSRAPSFISLPDCEAFLVCFFLTRQPGSQQVICEPHGSLLPRRRSDPLGIAVAKRTIVAPEGAKYALLPQAST